MPHVTRHVLGEAFTQAAPMVQALHRSESGAVWQGRVAVRRGRGWLARTCAWITGLPPVMADAPLQVRFQCDAESEVWQRDFAGHAMVSRLHAADAALGEALGPVRFRFALQVVDGAILWRVRTVRLFGLLPLPARWFARVTCREGERNGRYVFHVRARLPWLGEVIAYDGWLRPQ